MNRCRNFILVNNTNADLFSQMRDAIGDYILGLSEFPEELSGVFTIEIVVREDGVKKGLINWA